MNKVSYMYYVPAWATYLLCGWLPLQQIQWKPFPVQHNFVRNAQLQQEDPTNWPKINSKNYILLTKTKKCIMQNLNQQ